MEPEKELINKIVTLNTLQEGPAFTAFWEKLFPELMDFFLTALKQQKIDTILNIISLLKEKYPTLKIPDNRDPRPREVGAFSQNLIYLLTHKMQRSVDLISPRTELSEELIRAYEKIFETLNHTYYVLLPELARQIPSGELEQIEIQIKNLHPESKERQLKDDLEILKTSGDSLLLKTYVQGLAESAQWKLRWLNRIETYSTLRRNSIMRYEAALQSTLPAYLIPLEFKMEPELQNRRELPNITKTLSILQAAHITMKQAGLLALEELEIPGEYSEIKECLLLVINGLPEEDILAYINDLKKRRLSDDHIKSCVLKRGFKALQDGDSPFIIYQKTRALLPQKREQELFSFTVPKEKYENFLENSFLFIKKAENNMERLPLLFYCWAKQAKNEGLLALEIYKEEINDGLLYWGLTMLLEGEEPAFIISVIQESEYREKTEWKLHYNLLKMGILIIYNREKMDQLTPLLPNLIPFKGAARQGIERRLEKSLEENTKDKPPIPAAFIGSRMDAPLPYLNAINELKERVNYFSFYYRIIRSLYGFKKGLPEIIAPIKEYIDRFRKEEYPTYFYRNRETKVPWELPFIEDLMELYEKKRSYIKNSRKIDKAESLFFRELDKLEAEIAAIEAKENPKLETIDYLLDKEAAADVFDRVLKLHHEKIEKKNRFNEKLEQENKKNIQTLLKKIIHKDISLSEHKEADIILLRKLISMGIINPNDKNYIPHKQSLQEVIGTIYNFEDLEFTDDNGIQELLQQTDLETLAIALKGTSDTIRNKFNKQMGERAIQMLNEKIEINNRISDKETQTARYKLLLLLSALQKEI